MKLTLDISPTARQPERAAAPTPQRGILEHLAAIPVQASRVVRNFLFDVRYGGWLGSNMGRQHFLSRPGANGSTLGEYTYSRHHPMVCLSNSGVEFLPTIFRGRIKPSDILVDVGCGRGRVISWWLEQGCANLIYGLEIDPLTAERTRRRYSRYRNVSIVTGDAVGNIPAHGTLFYLFNPFDEATVTALRDRLLQIAIAPERVTILYYKPQYARVFEADPAWNVRIEPVGGSRAAPFHPLAVITMKR